ncbi:MAG TPA: aspartate aminotransferase family protein [Thermodesulfobacteriota bacterium]|nr:aspartate aminotransferase family protein [Thermodesulfobacteriota bacterium]
MNRKEVYEKHKKYLVPCVAAYYKEPLILDRGSGKHVYDIDGKEYLDFFGGIVTISLGHCDQEVTSKVCDQIKRLQHTSTLYPNVPIVSLAEKLAQITPGKLQKSFFTNSGTEAIETSVLLAELYTKSHEIIALRHGYSGASLLAMNLTAHSNYRLTETLVSGIKHAHNAYCYRCAFGKEYPHCDLDCAKDVKELIETTTSRHPAAFLAEPIQGVGGFITPPKEYFKEVLSIVRKYGALFICDEVQTGWGRTGGKMFGIEQWEVEPDIMVMAKGAANGAPVGITIATPEVGDSLSGSHLSTFGGNPVTATAILATIEVIEKRKLVQNAEKMGAYLRDRLNGLKEKYPIIGEVRGMGLIQGMEIVKEKKEPAPDFVAEIFETTKEQGLLIGKGGLYGNVIRITPPLTIDRGDIDQALQIMDRAFEKIQAFHTV